MLKKLFPIFAAILIAAPSASHALEQSFSQNGLKATIKLTPDELTAGSKVALALKLEKDGQPVTDRKVTLEVFGKDAAAPLITKEVDLLEGEYVDSWNFEKAGDYRVALNIADPQKPGETLHYEVKASVGEAKDAGHGGHEGHDFFSHHFGGGKWGWWGAGLMLVIMLPMMLL